MWELNPAAQAAGPTEITGGGGLRLSDFDLSDKQRGAVGGAARQLYRQMAEFYRVEVELPVGVAKPRGWKLEVVDEQGKRRKHFEVRSPRKLVPCVRESRDP